jgi:hypothetical protein
MSQGLALISARFASVSTRSCETDERAASNREKADAPDLKDRALDGGTISKSSPRQMKQIDSISACLDSTSCFDSRGPAAVTDAFGAARKRAMMAVTRLSVYGKNLFVGRLLGVKGNTLDYTSWMLSRASGQTQ